MIISFQLANTLLECHKTALKNLRVREYAVTSLVRTRETESNAGETLVQILARRKQKMAQGTAKGKWVRAKGRKQ